MANMAKYRKMAGFKPGCMGLQAPPALYADWMEYFKHSAAA